jgi:hypothetical protein
MVVAFSGNWGCCGGVVGCEIVVSVSSCHCNNVTQLDPRILKICVSY